MSTVTYNEAADALGISRSAVERRIRLTGTPVEHRGGRAYVDLETLQDAWYGRRAAIRSERVGGASLSVSITERQRASLEAMTSGEPGALARVTRMVLDAGLRALEVHPPRD